MKKQLFIIGLLAITLGACGTEVARINITQAGSHSINAKLSGNTETVFWTEWDANSQGGFKARYLVSVSQNGQNIAQTECNPEDTSITMNSVTTQLNSNKSARYEGKMRCALTVPTDGEYAVGIDFQVASETGQYKINKANLVIKQ